MTTSEGSERRRFSRVSFDTAASIAQGDSVFHTHVLDISINGILVDTPENYDIRADKHVDISIILTEGAEILMRAIMVHSSSKFLGFQCESIDMESVSHLRRLIELNLEDANASERVLSELVLPH